MFCSKCGQDLNLNGVCTNPSCPSNSTTNSEPNANYNNQYQPMDMNSYNESSYNQNSQEYADKDGITPNEMMDFIGDKKTEFYMEKWTRYQENEKFISWNWPAFLFNLLWFAYRKMYGVAGIIFGISFASGAISELIGIGSLSSLVGLAVMVGSGLLANQLYIKNCITKINKTKNALPGMSSDDLSRRLRVNGGITWVPVIIIVGIYFVLIVLLFILLAAAIGSAGSLMY